jgi:hypothetical protein
MSKTTTFNRRHFCGIAGAAVATRFVNGTSFHGDESMSLFTETAKSLDGELQDILDLLLTQEFLGVTFIGAAIERAPRTPSEAFLPVLRSAVTAEFVHGEAVKKAGGKPLTTSFWFPDAAFGGGGAGLFSTIESVEEIEISLYLAGVSAYARAAKDVGARMCGEALGVEAEHRALARFAQDKLGKDVGVPNDRGFQNFGWPTAAKARAALEALGVGFGKPGVQPGRMYEYPGDPVARGVGTPLKFSVPA